MKKILVVEDEKDVGRILQLQLQQQGFEVTLVKDGLAAVTAAQKTKPNLILLDLMLPGGDGLTVLKRLKMSFHTNSIPIIILTGMHDPQYKARIDDIGVEAFLFKPYKWKSCYPK